jgi:hypothetical protein
MSFLKYAQDPDVLKGNGRGPVSFTRARIDGMPFRGKTPLLKEEEFESQTTVNGETYVKTFDTSDPEQLKEYTRIVDGVVNHLYRMVYRNHRWVEKPDGPAMFVYIEWTYPALEFTGVAP